MHIALTHHIISLLACHGLWLHEWFRIIQHWGNWQTTCFLITWHIEMYYTMVRRGLKFLLPSQSGVFKLNRALFLNKKSKMTHNPWWLCVNLFKRAMHTERNINNFSFPRLWLWQHVEFAELYRCHRAHWADIPLSQEDFPCSERI